MNLKSLAAVSVSALVLLSAPAFAAYDGWIAGGMDIYSVEADKARVANKRVTRVCSKAEGVDCTGAFTLPAGSAVVKLSCTSGDMSGYVVGESESAVEKIIESSIFNMADCALME